MVDPTATLTVCCAFHSAMVRHRGIGMNRPKKRKVSPLVPVSVTEEEPEEEPSELPQPTPAPALVCREVAASMAEVAEQASSVDRLLDPVDIVDDLLEKIRCAELRLAQAERSWEKTKVTYSDYTAHPLFDCKSVMERDEERLLAADRQLGEARAQLAWHRQIYTRYRTFFRLSERVLDRPTDRVLRAFQHSTACIPACACAASYSEVGVHVARNACGEHLGL